MTAPAREAGTCGAAVFTIDLARCGTCTDSSGVAKAAETADAVPLTGSRVLPGAGAPTVSPSPRRTEETCATSAVLGPKAAANCAEVR